MPIQAVAIFATLDLARPILIDLFRLTHLNRQIPI